jgi:hypothetical protein
MRSVAQNKGNGQADYYQHTRDYERQIHGQTLSQSSADGSAELHNRDELCTGQWGVNAPHPNAKEKALSLSYLKIPPRRRGFIVHRISNLIWLIRARSH